MAEHRPEKRPADLPAAARFLASDEGGKLSALALQLAEERVPEHNAQRRIAALASPLVGPAISPEIALLAWTMAVERKRAVAKLGEEIGRLALFDSDGLQMASSAALSSYHAHILVQAGARRVIDMTAGIGADSLAFGLAGMEVVAFEADRVRAVFVASNVERLALGGKIIVRECDSMDAYLEDLTSGEGAFVFLDPPRRTESARWGNYDVADRMIERALASGASGVLAKLAPAVDRGIAARYGGDLEFVSHDGECKEALLRFGASRSNGGDPAVSAVLLPGWERLTGREEIPPLAPSGDPSAAAYLHEPDPAVIRSGLIDVLAAGHDLWRIDPGIAYLLSSHAVTTPFAVSYRILAAFPYHRRNAQAWLDERGAGSLIVKKRGVPDEPESVRRQFKLQKGGPPAILALTRQGKRVWAFLLEPCGG